MRIKTRFTAIGLCLLICLSFLAPAPAEGPARALTLMIYLTGSDLESGSGAASSDISEMLGAGLTRDVTVLLLVGGSQHWELGFAPEETALIELGPRGMRVVERWVAMNMGDPETLAMFLNASTQRYPAERYALILWDHGGGPMNGVCFDELQGGDCLTLPELREALDESAFAAGERLEWIGFDACLMAGAETAKVCSPYARYMIASQETEPGCGWNYAFLGGIAEDADGAETGRRIISDYFDAAPEKSLLTLSCVDLKKIDGVELAVDAMFGELDGLVTETGFPGLSNCRRDARSFGRGSTGSDYDLVDLSDLADQYAPYAPEAAAGLVSAVDAAVICASSNIEGANGLSAYYPYYNKTNFTGLWSERYPELGFASDYCAYLRDYTGLWLGDQLVDFSGIEAEGEMVEQTQHLTLQLSQAQAANYASAQLNILAQANDMSNAYIQIYTTDDVVLGADGLLSADYDYAALYALDGEGIPLTDALQYIQVEDAYFIEGTLMARDVDEEDADAALMFRRPEGADTLEYAGTILLPEDMSLQEYLADASMPAPRQDDEIDTERWAGFYQLHFPQYPGYTESGALLPSQIWPLVPIMYFDSVYIDFSDTWQLAFCHQQYTGQQLCAQYVVTDVQGYMTASPLLPIDNPNSTVLSEIGAPLLDEEGVSLTVDRIEIVNAQFSSGVYIRLTAENRNAYDVLLRGDQLYMNGTALDRFDLLAALSGESRETISIYLDADSLPPLENRCLTELGLELRIQDGDGIRSCGGTAECEVALDTLGIADAAEMVPLAEAVDGDAIWQLMELAQDEEMLTARFRIINEGDVSYQYDYYETDYFSLNGCLVHGTIVGRSSTVPARGTQYVRMRLGLISSPAAGQSSSRPGYWGEAAAALMEEAYPEADRHFPPVNAIDYWGIRQIGSLTLFRSRDAGEVLTFVLKDPLPCDNAAEIHSQPLVDAGALTGEFRGMYAEDGALFLELALENRGDTSVRIGLERVTVNGGEVLTLSQTDLYTEQTIDTRPDDAAYIIIYTETLWPGVKQRALARLEVDAEEIAQIDIVFNANNETDGAAAFVFDEPLPWPAANGPLEGEVTVIPGGTAESGPIDPADMLEAEITLPEDPQSYSTTLSTQLSAEQAEAFGSASALLVRDHDSYLEIVASIKGGTVDENNVLNIPFSGLILALEGVETLPVQLVSGTTIQPLSLYLMTREIDMIGLDISVDYDGGKAGITAAEASEELQANRNYEGLVVYRMDLIPLPDGKGGYLPVADWGTMQDLNMDYYDMLQGKPRLEFRPARELGLYVVFNIKNTDGSGYALLEKLPLE